MAPVFDRSAASKAVTEVPPPYRRFREHPWEEDYPTWDRFNGVPEGYGEDSPEIAPAEAVWGLPNTDVNQHVNIAEYIAGMENYQSLLLHAAGLPVVRYRLRRADLLFMKPFFAGEAYRLSARLWRRGGETLFLGGIHKADGAGRWPAHDARPAVFARLEGRLEGEAP